MSDTLPATKIQDEFHINTPPEEYDHNFAAGRIRQLQSDKVVMIPFTPSLHAEKFSEMLIRYPEVRRQRRNQMSTLPDVIVWCENIVRQDTRKCLWALYSFDEDSKAQHSQPPMHLFAGIAGLGGYDPRNLSIEQSGIVVFPPFQKLNLATHALALTDAFVFTQLRLVQHYFRTSLENVPMRRVGEKCRFVRELTSRGCLGYGPPPFVSEEQGKELRDQFKYDQAITGSIFWDDWRYSEVKVLAESFHMDVSSPKVFKNGCTPENGWGLLPPLVDLNSTMESQEFNPDPTPHFKTSKCLLIPMDVKRFAPRIHAFLRTWEEGQKAIAFDLALDRQIESFGRSLDALSEWLESKMKGKYAYVWAIFCKTVSGLQVEDDLSNLTGFVVMKRDTRNAQSVLIGPLLIFPQYEPRGLEKPTLALLQTFAFESTTSNPSGLGVVRVAFRTQFQNESAIKLITSVGFVRDGVARFSIGPDKAVREKLSERGSDGDVAWKTGQFDPRESFKVDRFYSASVTWQEWEDGGQKARMSRLLL